MGIKTVPLKRKSVFFSWLISYISILLIPMVISSIVYIESSKIVEKEINQANQALLKQTKQAVDADIADIEKLSLQIAFNPRVQALLYANPPLASYQHYTIVQLVKDLGSYKIANGIVDNFYIYFNYSDIVITPTSVYTPALLHDHLYKDEGVVYEEWYNLIRANHNGELQPIVVSNELKRIAKNIAYMQSLPLNNMGKHMVTAVISIDERRFKDIVQNIKWVDSSTVVIIDDRDNIMALNGSADLAFSLSHKTLTEKSGTVHSSIEDQQVVISYMSSDNTTWKYVSITPAKVFMEKVKYIKRLTVISMILSMIIGGIVAYVFSRKNYSPLQQIVQSLAAEVGVVLDDRYNEYKFINDAVIAALSENEKIKDKLEQQNKVITDNFLVKFLKGKQLDIISFEDMQLTFDMQFYSDNFVVSLIYIEDFSKLFEDQNTMSAADQIKLVHFIIGNVMKETLEDDCDFYLLEVDDLLAGIINLKSKPNKNTIIDIKELIGAAQEFIEENFYIILSITLSDIVSGTSAMSSAYQQALDAMEYRMILGTGNIISYSDIQVSKPYYNYALEEEQKLINLIKTGDYDNAKDILLKVLNDNCRDSNISVDILKCLLSDLICTVMKAVDEEESLNMLLAQNPIECILSSTGIVEMKYEMLNLLYNVCEYNREKNEHIEYRFKHQITQYIEENYHDEDLNVSKIGEHFDMTPAYISRLFKEETGESLLDYINETRLKKAKELLLQNDLTVERVGQMVGYSNSNTFIRIFKKYEGITPGKYRDFM